MGWFLAWSRNYSSCYRYLVRIRNILERLTYVSKYLETYSLEDIIQLNDLTEEEVLLFLVEQEIIKLPDPHPVDLNE